MAEKNENTQRNGKEEKFQAKIKELLALAKKKKNLLEYLCVIIVILIIAYYLMVEFQKEILCFLLKVLTKLLFKNFKK